MLTLFALLACSQESEVTLADPPGSDQAAPVPEAPVPRPRLEVAEADAVGAADAQDVKSTVRRYSGQMKYCYETRLKVTPELEGRVELGWSFVDGHVESVFVVSNDTGDDELARCMVQKLKRWKFPKDMEGDVTWPFVFRADAEGN